jgi:Tannase-like family of unknown function (DUF6351)
MSRRGLRLAVIALCSSVVAVLLPAGPAVADSAHFTGRTANGQWVLDVPATFNGTLLLWSHGYTFVPVRGSSAPSAATRDTLLAQGYALVGSSYAHGGAGWAVKDGLRAGVEAISIAKARIGAGQVDRVYAWGNSLGGLITQTLAEQRPGLVQGVAPLCGVLAGTNRNLDLALDVAVAVKKFFYPPLRLRGYRSAAQAQANLSLASAAMLAKLADPATQAGASGRVLGIAAMVGGSAKTARSNGETTESAVAASVESLLTALNYSTIGRYDIERRVGGNPSTNVGTDYTARVTPTAVARFTAFGFGPGLLRSYAQSLQTYGARVSADKPARKAASRLGNPTGALADKTVTMHTVYDPLVISQNERVFAGRVAAQGRTSRLLQLFITPPTYTTSAPYGAGHCNFASSQYVGVITALNAWVITGHRPGSTALSSYFAATPGALNLNYRPASWPAH